MRATLAVLLVAATTAVIQGAPRQSDVGWFPAVLDVADAMRPGFVNGPLIVELASFRTGTFQLEETVARQAAGRPFVNQSFEAARTCDDRGRCHFRDNGIFVSAMRIDSLSDSFASLTVRVLYTKHHGRYKLTNGASVRLQIQKTSGAWAVTERTFLQAS